MSTPETKENPGLPLRGPTCSAARAENWKRTQELLHAATVAVNDLSNHLKAVNDLPRMYKANKAIHALWEIE